MADLKLLILNAADTYGDFKVDLEIVRKTIQSGLSGLYQQVLKLAKDLLRHDKDSGITP